MSWKKEKLSVVAPAKAHKLINYAPDHEIWQVNLDHIEVNTGKLLKRDIRQLSEVGSSTHAFNKEHVLYSKLRPYLNKVLLPDTIGIGTTELVPMLPKSKLLDRNYLAHYLKSKEFVTWISSKTAGAKMPRVSMNVFWQHEIPLPPLDEQKRIAAILDKADSLRSKRKEVIALNDKFLRSTFLEMFGDPVANSKGWKVDKLSDLSTKINSGSTPVGGSKVYVEKGIPFLRSQNVWRNRVELDDIVYLDEATHEKMSKTSLKNRDLLITKTGRINTENSSLGRAAMFTGEDGSANVNGHVYLIRLKPEVINEFVLYIMTTIEYRDYIRSVCVGGIDKRQINKGHLEQFPIIAPPVELQQQFLERLQIIEKQKVVLNKQLELANNMFAALTQQAFNGELSIQDKVA